MDHIFICGNIGKLEFICFQEKQNKNWHTFQAAQFMYNIIEKALWGAASILNHFFLYFNINFPLNSCWIEMPQNKMESGSSFLNKHIALKDEK